MAFVKRSALFYFTRKKQSIRQFDLHYEDYFCKNVIDNTVLRFNRID